MKKGNSLTGTRPSTRPAPTAAEKEEAKAKYQARVEARDCVLAALKTAGFEFVQDRVFAGIHNLLVKAPNGEFVRLEIES